jgi:N-acetylglutamate synthase-like GNAT family acetyltransferase
VITICEPVTPEDFEAYYLLRWEILRKPWDHPRGSEKDEQENSSFHFMAVNEKNEVVGVSRLQKNSPTEGQVRFMAVRDDQQGKGVGKKLMARVEEKAKQEKLEKIVLQSRENAVEFYKAIGYTITEKTFRLWDVIQHYKMEKQLK